jgi:hypothetical protein
MWQNYGYVYFNTSIPRQQAGRGNILNRMLLLCFCVLYIALVIISYEVPSTFINQLKCSWFLFWTTDLYHFFYKHS